MGAIAPPYIVDFDLSAMPRIQTNVIVIGAGIAGLYTAIKASEQDDVILITKKSLYDSNTQYAQGGIAAVTAADDSPVYHRQDTLIAGAGLCDIDAVDVLVHEGPAGVQELIQFGTQFDIDAENGEFALTREGAHSQRRILHARGDATGAEIVRALLQQAKQNERIAVWDDHFAIDLVTHAGECHGVIVENRDGERMFVQAKATVLCTGGAGQLYRYTTNPDVATADGIAMAYRAGAQIKDVEFVQFHPTALCYPHAPRFLISEALRGEGAILRNIKGERFMSKYDERLELAPRDVVARAIIDEMEASRSTFVYIDITDEPAAQVKMRFPTIYAYCLQYGLDLTCDWIPVAPAAHYMMGGVKTDLYGETSLKRLFACGEVSATGVHGANRLASNSLSEAIVFGRRIVERIAQLEANEKSIVLTVNEARLTAPSPGLIEKRLELQKVMLRYVGLKRDEVGLNKGWERLRKEQSLFQSKLMTREAYEYANLLTCALLVTQSAINRQESRGAHYRADYPRVNDVAWRYHTLWQRDEGFTKEDVHDA